MFVQGFNVRNLKELFEKLDTSKDGRLSLVELDKGIEEIMPITHLTKTEIRELMK